MEPEQPYIVTAYDETAFHTYLKEFNDHLLSNKAHVKYFKKYLAHYDVKTIIIEHNYIDRYYLEDYANYYVRCFTHYERFCKRLHLFKGQGGLGFTHEDFARLLGGDHGGRINAAILNDLYIGFVVLKPLPETLIGRTCLEQYEKDATDFTRHYPITKSCEVGLFGIKLKVKNTLPFQEQDKVVSACATSALWTLFHAVPFTNSFQVKSPASITRIATQNTPFRASTYPVMGLTPEMMGQALVSEGLEAHHISLVSSFKADQYQGMNIMKEILYAYLNNKIPALLGVDVYRKTDRRPPAAEHIGKHAVAITGYAMPKSVRYQLFKKGFFSKASLITKLYVHDDQVGPFCKVSFGNDAINCATHIDNNDIAFRGKADYWLKIGLDDVATREIGIPNNIVIGLYHKIRLPYIMIREGVKAFNELLNYFISKSPDVEKVIFHHIAKAFIWDIHLTTPTELKAEIARSGLVTGKKLESILTRSMPRFIWRAKAEYENLPVFDLLFDATDIPQGNVFLGIVEYDENISAWFDFIFGEGNKYFPLHISVSERELLSKIVQGIGAREPVVETTLADIYGYARPPIRIKPHEQNSDGSVKIAEGLLKAPFVANYEFDPSLKYLWAVTESGTLLVAAEAGDPPIGHPNLTGGNPARICGQFYLDKEQNLWIIDNVSGRYSLYAPGEADRKLENVRQKLFEPAFPQYEGKIQCQVSSRHGSHIINTLDDITQACASSAAKETDDEMLQTVAVEIVVNHSDKIADVIDLTTKHHDRQIATSLFWLVMHILRRIEFSVADEHATEMVRLYEQYPDDMQLRHAIIGSLVEICCNRECIPETVTAALKQYFCDNRNQPKTDVMEKLTQIYRRLL